MNSRYTIFFGINFLFIFFFGCKQVEVSPTDSKAAVRIYGFVGNDIMNAGVPTKDGGALFCGHVNGKTPGDWDVFALKTDENGNVIWFTTLPGARQDDFLAIAETPDGGAVATGNTLSFGAPMLSPEALADLWIVKFDAAGNVQWQDTVGGGRKNGYGYETGTCLYVENNGEIVVAGSTTSYEILPFPAFNELVIKVKYGANGNKIWQSVHGTNSFIEIPTDVTLNNFKEMVILATEKRGMTSSNEDFVVLQTSRDSSLIQSRSIKNIHPHHFEAGKIRFLDNGNILLFGAYKNDSVANIPYPISPYFVRYDADFNIISEWYYFKYPEHNEVASSYQCLNGDLVFLVNHRPRATSTDIPRIKLIKVTLGGNILFDNFIDLPLGTIGRSIVELNNGNLMVGLSVSRNNIGDRDMGFLIIDAKGNVKY